MASNIKQALESIHALNPQERAFLAHCLLTSLHENQEQGVDGAWARIAEARLKELQAGNLAPLSWQQIKQKATSL